MKSTRRIIVALAAMGILALSGIAQANQTFSISGININPASDPRDWSTSTLAVSNFTLTQGQSKTFDYAKFNYNSYNLFDTDSLTASFTVTPPGAPAQYDLAQVSHVSLGLDADVDFNDPGRIITFGNGGKYSLTFLDTDDVELCGYDDLQATVKLICDSQPVPEPGTMMLLGAGFLGLAVWGKRRNKA